MAAPAAAPRARETLDDMEHNPRKAQSVSLLGIPLEQGAGVPGALMGPDALRTAGLPAVLKNLGHSVRDHGNLAVPADIEVALAPQDAARCRNLGAIGAWTQLIHDRAFEVLGNGDMPIFLGGDHSLSMGTVSAVARHCAATGKELAVLWIDAHADFNTPATTPSGNMHGMSIAFLTGEPSLRALLGGRPFTAVKPSDVHIIGLRSVDPEESDRLIEYGVDCADMRMIDEFGVSVLVRRMIEELEGRNVHLHVSLDVDSIDPALAPGVGTTVPGGITYREAHLIMEMLHDSGMVGSLDIVELNPFLDERGKSAMLLAELTASLFGRTVLDRRPGQLRAA